MSIPAASPAETGCMAPITTTKRMASAGGTHRVAAWRASRSCNRIQLPAEKAMASPRTKNSPRFGTGRPNSLPIRGAAMTIGTHSATPASVTSTTGRTASRNRRWTNAPPTTSQAAAARARYTPFDGSDAVAYRSAPAPSSRGASSRSTWTDRTSSVEARRAPCSRMRLLTGLRCGSIIQAPSV